MKCINEMQKNKILRKKNWPKGMRNIAWGPCQIDSVKLSLLHPQFLRCMPKVGVSRDMRFLINSSIGIKTKSLYQFMNKCHGILCSWHRHFLFGCLQLETIWASIPSSTTKMIKLLRLVLFLTYRMSRFLRFCFTKIYLNSPSS